MPVALSLVLVVAFLAMNAFFVIAEFSMVRVRPSQIEVALADGRSGAVAAKEIAGNVNAYLSACQLGITLASLALGWLGEPAFSELIRPTLSLAGMPDAAISAIAVAIGYLIMTTLHVVVGELIPKSFAIFSTERYALGTARALVLFYRVTYPVMWLFNALTAGVMRLAGHTMAEEREAYTDEEIKYLLDESTEDGLIDAERNEIVDNIIDIGDKDAEAIMTPRIDVVCIDLDDSLEENLQLARNYKYTRYPVCQGSKDRIVGFVHIKDLYTAPLGLSREGVAAGTGVGTLDGLRVRPIEAVPEGISIVKLLQLLQRSHSKIAVVVDEHGGTAGIVTMTDIMEQIVGRIQDEYGHGESGGVREVGPGSYHIDGSLPIDETVELIGFTPDEAVECETAGGLLLTLFDRIPAEGDQVEVSAPASDGLGQRAVFTVIDMDVHRIDKIQVDLPQVAGEEMVAATD